MDLIPLRMDSIYYMLNEFGLIFLLVESPQSTKLARIGKFKEGENTCFDNFSTLLFIENDSNFHFAP